MAKKVNLLVFSGDYDKAFAALMIANGARNNGMEVSMFFAFWGLFLLRDPERVDNDAKTTYEQMLGAVTPKGPEDLGLSRMNFMGIGKALMKDMMEEDDAPSLTRLFEGARKRDVKFCACKLSMEVMGFKKGELIPEVEVMDVTHYLNDATQADLQLFI
ncbi:MAG: DsrE/DsrF/DrsH-like family protein [Bacillota bacterium]|nr:DsrE/DsrF/DrsH-like family protein [Bacillota bacterium]